MRHPTRIKHLEDFLDRDTPPSRIDQAEAEHRAILLRWLDQNPLADIYEQEQLVHQERRRIEQLIQEHGMKARKHSQNGQRGERSRLLRQILEDAGTPLHYTVIHEQALSYLSSDQNFSKEQTYSTLFYSRHFRLLNEGVFALAEWNPTQTNDQGEILLQHAPTPLLPDGADARAFFESVMVGREVLSQRPDMTVRQFASEMWAWAGYHKIDWQSATTAFDAWYAAGLIEYIDILQDLDQSLRLSLNPDLNLQGARIKCLHNLCRRIMRMPDLLLALTRLPRSTEPDISRVLFGNPQAAFDLKNRLSLLRAFEAVQETDGAWQLTQVGQQILNTIPPIDSVEFSSLATNTHFRNTPHRSDNSLDLEWEEDMGLLDL